MRLPAKKKKQVFLIYATEDGAISREITKQLEISGFSVAHFEYELLWDDSMANKMRNVISSGDYIFFLLSKNSLRSEWVRYELSATYLDELATRDVTVIPVLIDYSKVPDFLSKFQMLDLRKKTSGNIRKVISQILNAPRIDLSSLSGYEFLRLAADLLKKLRFRNIKTGSGVEDRGIDLMAEFYRRDPFGVENKEVWIVETKFYQNERASLKSLRALAGSLTFFPDAKALLITNGLLTSYARKWLQDISGRGRHIRVIEGPELRNLLLRFPDLVDQYFPPASQRVMDAD